jgi:hypothetical protein
VANLVSVGFTGENEVDLEALRSRLRKMNDMELLRFGQAAKNMSSPSAYFGQPPRRAFMVQLEEARQEMATAQSRTGAERINLTNEAMPLSVAKQSNPALRSNPYTGLTQPNDEAP